MTHFQYKYVPNITWDILTLNVIHYFSPQFKVSWVLYICVVFGGISAGSLTYISKDHAEVLEVSWRGLVSWAAVQLCTPGLAAGIQRGGRGGLGSLLLL